VRNYLLTLLVAAAVTYLLTAPVRRFAVRHHAMAEVRDRDVHDVPTPRLGGLAMFGGFAAGMLVASKLPLLRTVFENGSREWLALLSGAFLICLLGAADDRWGLDAVTKLAGQVLAAGVMALQGVQLLWLPLGTLTYVPPESLGVLLTVLVVVVAINAVNFVDGLDGLAAGITMISAGSLFVFSYILWVVEQVDRAATPTMITAIVVGCCAGFLPHNFYPARIFMGDSGSMLLGLLLAASAVTLTGTVEPSAVTSIGLVPALIPLLLPVLALLVPLTDLLLAVVRRTRAGVSPFSPDKRHLHHRLLEIGHSHRRAVLIMYAWTALLALGTLVLAILDGLWPKVVVGVVVLGAFAATLRPGGNLPTKPRAAAATTRRTGLS
jgi:UDP-GlcNAc:undecaprenyl-phosphate/decaprenyl-phosphate GlcNAc-1-phosphate transferase